MHIGTPLSPNATRVMLLGSGELGKEIVIALQRLGIEAIAVDRYANAPAHHVAHRAHVIAMNDAVALRRLIDQEHPDFVVPELDGIPPEPLHAVERERVTQVVPSAHAVELTCNREATRRLAQTLGLQTSAHRFVETQAELQAAIERDIGYPCVVKPVISSSGEGQSILRGKPDIAAAWQYAESSARVRGSRVMVEQFVEFEVEVTLLAIRSQHHDAVITSFCEPIGHRQAGGDYVESWQPQAMSPRALDRAKAMARLVTDELGGRGVFGVDFFVRGDEVWFADVSPRPPDTGLVTMCTQAQSAFELHARAMLGLPVDVTLRTAGASAVIHAGIEGRAIRYDNVAQALEVPQSDLRLFGKPEAYRRRRMGVALANASTPEEARERARECARRVHPAI